MSSMKSAVSFRVVFGRIGTVLLIPAAAQCGELLSEPGTAQGGGGFAPWFRYYARAAVGGTPITNFSTCGHSGVFQWALKHEECSIQDDLVKEKPLLAPR